MAAGRMRGGAASIAHKWVTTAGLLLISHLLAVRHAVSFAAVRIDKPNKKTYTIFVMRPWRNWQTRWF